MKETKRKAFNFMRSYFDVLNELEKDKDKLAFLMAVINKQFLNEDPDLTGMAKFAYISQINAIEKSVKGWQDATGQALTGAYQDPCKGPLGSPLEQEKEEEKEEGKEKNTYIPTFDEFKNHALSKKSNIDLEHLRMKYDAWIENGWKNGHGNKIKNWKGSLNNTIPYIKTLSSSAHIQQPKSLKDLYE